MAMVVMKTDIVGKRFGKLIALRWDRFENGQSYWECVCDCGKIIVTRRKYLGKGTTSCGCSRNKPCPKKQKGYKDLSGNYYCDLRWGALKRNLAFEITPEDVWEVYEAQGRKCALSGVLITFVRGKCHNTTASVDRIDSSKGYFKSNIQLVHKTVNRMKSNIEQAEFISWCKSIAGQFNRS